MNQYLKSVLVGQNLSIARLHGRGITGALLQSWKALYHENHQIPRRSDLKPSMIVPALPSMLITEQVDGRPVVRLSGTEIDSFLGQSLKDQPLDSIFPEPNAERVRQFAQAMTSLPCGGYNEEILTMDDGTSRTFRSVSLPMSDDVHNVIFVARAIEIVGAPIHNLNFEQVTITNREPISDGLIDLGFGLPPGMKISKPDMEIHGWLN